jgi:predicted TIM-barrel fold metal-dependent hydrolase
MKRYAADCHAHIFDPAYPFSPGSHYIPEHAQRGTAADFAAVLDAHGFSHGLLVGAAPYASDNRAMLDGLRSSGGRFKGIALVRDSGLTPQKQKEFADAGVVGIRINLMTYGLEEIKGTEGERLLAKAREMGWFVQVHLHAGDLVPAAAIFRKAGVRLVFDHFGRPDVDKGLDQPGFAEMLEFGRSGNAVAKLSGPFRASKTGYPYKDVDRFVAAVIEAFTLDNCVWGSDWPFVRMEQRVDYGPPLTCLPRWVPSEADLQKVVWENPRRLFGFKPL